MCEENIKSDIKKTTWSFQIRKLVWNSTKQQQQQLLFCNNNNYEYYYY